MEKVKDLDLYLLLGIPSDASEKDIKKAYRKKALTCHPDKNPDNPKAIELFHQLSDALSVLTDPKARKAYNDVLKAKKAAELRNRELDAKRKKLKDDLELRELKARKEQEEAFLRRGNPEELFQKELERLRKEGQKQMEEEQERVRQLLKDQAKEKGTIEKNSGPTKLKVKWKKGSYTKEELQTVFSKFGCVNEVVVLAHKNVGLVEMATKSAASAAHGIEKGFIDRPLKIKMLDADLDPNPPQPSQRVATGAIFEASNFNDFESLVMRQMRQAEERKRLEAEILAQDELENS